MDVKKELENIPHKPGIYRFLDKNQSILYIGKAKDLKKRVTSYFSKTLRKDRPRLIPMVADIFAIKYIITTTEKEALILEDKLIKAHQPKYNISLKDGKSYSYLRITLFEDFPRLEIVRKIVVDGSLYFGPYTSGKNAFLTHKWLQSVLLIRKSKFDIKDNKTYKPCLNFQLKRCLAPCAGKVTKEEYKQIIDTLIAWFKGENKEWLGYLQEEMQRQSELLNFEKAMFLRDTIKAAEKTFTVRAKTGNLVNTDVFAIVREGGFAGVHVLFVRNNHVLSDDFIFFQKGELFEDQELLRSVFSKLYLHGAPFFPKEIILAQPYENEEEFINHIVTEKKAHIKFVVPIQGEKRKLLEMAQDNGEQQLHLSMVKIQSDEVILEEVQRYLRLKNLPRYVECFDISHLSGTNGVASMVVSKDNQPYKEKYRKYHIKEAKTGDDFASMQEVLERRYTRLLEQRENYPDLIIIDGGKGQLSAALQVFESIGLPLDKIDVIGMAKGRSKKKQGVVQEIEDFEYVVKPNRKDPVLLFKQSKTLHFLQRIRDEAHRFAITFQRKHRTTKALRSQLTEIPGIGEQKKNNLLKHFKSLKNISQASPEELVKVKGITQGDSERIQAYFQEKE